MVYLMIYLNVNCLLLWYEFIFKHERIKKDLKRNFENIDIDEYSNSTIMLIATFSIILTIIAILPWYVVKTIKRLL